MIEIIKVFILVSNRDIIIFSACKQPKYEYGPENLGQSIAAAL